MFQWLINLFKKKEKRLVAIVSAHYSFRYQYASTWNDSGVVGYYLYEYSNGKRKVELTRNTDSVVLDTSNLERTKHWNVIKAWEAGAYDSVNIPTFKMMEDLRKPAVLDLPSEDYLNKL